MSASIQSLPSELLGEVLDCLIPWDANDIGRYDDLQSAALVCRSWRWPAQRALFTSLILVDDGEGENTVRAEAWLKSPARARYPTTHISLPTGYQPPVNPEVLAACPGVISLTATGPDCGYHWCTLPSAAGLKELVVHYPEHFPTDAAPLPQHFRSLTLMLNVLSSTSTLTTLFLSSIDTLSTLHLISTDSQPAVELAKFLSRVKPTQLRKLVLEGTLHAIHVPDIINALPDLKEIEIELNLKHITAIASCAAPHLEVLTLRHRPQFTFRVQNTVLNELLRIIQLPHLSHLRYLRLPTVPKDRLAGPSGVALVKECEERSISFFCRYGYLTRDIMLALDVEELVEQAS